MPAKVINQWEGEDEDDDVKVSTTFILRILIVYPRYFYIINFSRIENYQTQATL